MHPAMMGWWASRRRAHEEGACAHAGGCGPGYGHSRGGHETRHAGHGHDEDFGGGSFGVRRPLRFLAWKLELEENQVAELAKILDDLKTERAQAAVDNRRSTSAFADGMATSTFDEAKVREAAELRVKTAERLRDAVVTALSRIHRVLDGEQRERFAYLIRTGALSI
ncbi:MAG TPA: Spy/CpxP family protein refolding chaperone [Polyangiaceae bacterium]|nr:Spy/CpxP family protein refolding chaperone [Polyangiaceae bacterium]